MTNFSRLEVTCADSEYLFSLFQIFADLVLDDVKDSDSKVQFHHAPDYGT